MKSSKIDLMKHLLEINKWPIWQLDVKMPSKMVS